MKFCSGKLYLAFVLLLLICSSCMLPQRRAELDYKMGLSKAQSGNQSDAIVYFSNAIKLNPRYDSAYLVRGAAKQTLQDFGAAINDYSKAIELNPSNELAFDARACT
jgi:tetratricopeptide (TPR) repeat protein